MSRLQRRWRPGAGGVRGPWIYIFAVLLFVVVFVVSIRELPPVELEWRWLLATGALVPFVLILNGIEYRLAGRLLGHRVGLGEAVRVSIISSAANLLPVPGAILVRSEALRRRGAGYSGAFRSTSAVGVGWLATAFLFAGGAQLVTGQAGIGSLLMAFGVAGVAGTVLLARRGEEWPGIVSAIVAVEAVFVLVSAGRLFAVFQGLGVPCTPEQALFLTLAAAIAAAAGIFPGGLGIREALAGALSVLVSVPAAAGALAAAVDRIVGVVVLSVAAALVAAGRTRPRERTRSSSMSATGRRAE